MRPRGGVTGEKINVTRKTCKSVAVIGLLCAVPAAAATPFFFSTGDPDGKIATATRPDVGGPFEIESADDFVLTHSTSITSATFTGLVPAGATVGEVVVEIYRVFPEDSDVTRTSGPPTFSTSQVPTRVNSPSDVAFDARDIDSGLTFSTDVLSASSPQPTRCSPAASIPLPTFNTGGNGPVTGEEVQFSVTFTTPFLLPADHYFFVPQVQLIRRRFLVAVGAEADRSAGDAVPARLHRPAKLDPRRSPRSRLAARRHGHRRRNPAPTFNAAFSLTGAVVPEPSTWAMMLLGFAGLGFAGYRQARKARPASA